VAFRIEETLEIDAPADVVWQVITDLPRYGEWNPFVVACRSTLVVGETIEMRVRIFSGLAQPQRETVLEHLPLERLCYGLPGGRLGALASRRCHELRAAGAGRTRYQSRFELSGFLSPVVRALLGARLERGFGAMTAALRRRAEDLGGRRAGTLAAPRPDRAPGPPASERCRA
jgi:hypothetical protein